MEILREFVLLVLVMSNQPTVIPGFHSLAACEASGQNIAASFQEMGAITQTRCVQIRR